MTPNFIKKHPTPWKLTLVGNPKYPNLDNHEEIQDANGKTVIASYDAESYFSGFTGAENLVDFINTQYPNKDTK